MQPDLDIPYNLSAQRIPLLKLYMTCASSTRYFNFVSGFCVHLKNTSRELNELTTLVEFDQIGGACYAYDDVIRALIHVVSGYPPL